MALDSRAADFVAIYQVEDDLYELIIKIIKNIPDASIVFFALIITMIAFYATSVDSIELTTSCYSYKKVEEGEESHKFIK